METGRDHSLSQRRPGRNNLTLPNNDPASQIVPELTPKGDETQGTKFTDSAFTCKNPRLILAKLGITHVVCTGIFTAPCLPSTARSLADEGPKVMVLPIAAAAGQTSRHDRERVVQSMFDGAVMSADETLGYLPG